MALSRPSPAPGCSRTMAGIWHAEPGLTTAQRAAVQEYEAAIGPPPAGV